MDGGLKSISTSNFLWWSSIGTNILMILLLGFLLFYVIHIGNDKIYSQREKSNRKKYLLYFVAFGAISLAFWGLYSIRNMVFKIFGPILWAMVFAYLLNPFVVKLEKRRISRLWSVIIIYIGILSIVVLVSITITPKITKETRNLVELLPKYTNETYETINHLYEKIEQLDHFSPQLAGIKEPIKENLDKVESFIVNTIKNITRAIFNIFSQIVGLVLIPIFSFYFLKDLSYFRKKILFIIPKSLRNELMNIFKDIDVLLSKFIRGQIIVAACVGVLSTIALLIIDVDFAFLIGMIAGISNVIPYIGPIIGAIPGVIFGLLDEPAKAIWVVIAFTIIQQIESAVLSPKIVGESVGLHPVSVIISLFIGNELFGVLGMLFAVPVAASIKIVGKHMLDLIVKV